MLRFVLQYCFLFVSTSLFCQVELRESHLPIFIVNTQGQSIPDEPKITVDLKVINNGPNEINSINDTSFEYNGPIGFELRGQTSQDLFPKKGYGFETRNEDGTNNNVKLLGLPKENDWVLHGPYSDKTLIRNALTFTMAEKFMIYAPRVKFCELVIDEEYRGVYLLIEKIKVDKNRVNISKIEKEDIAGDALTGGYMLKFDKKGAGERSWISDYKPIQNSYQNTEFIHLYPKSNDITPEQQNYIRGFISDFEDALMGNDYLDDINGYKNYIDEDSFVDLILINEVTKNLDSYRISTYMYKDRDSIDGRLKMGPAWDYNLGYGNANFCSGERSDNWALDFNQICPGDFWVNHVWWARMLSDTAFTNKLESRWFSLRQSVFSDDNWNSTIDSLVMHVGDAADRNFERWPTIGSWIWPNSFVGQTYQSEVNYLKNWVKDRLNWIDENIEGLSTFQKFDINKSLVFPNPSQGNLCFKIPEIWSSINTKLIVFDVLGKVVVTKTFPKDDPILELEFYNSGLYHYIIIKNDTDLLDNNKFIISN